MKKSLLFGLLVAGSTAAYYLIKKLEEKTSSNEDIKFLQINDEQKYSAEVEEIAELYPFLSKKFIEKVYLQNDKLNEDYPQETLVEIKHYASFSEDDVLLHFVRIMENNGYEVIRNEKDFIVIKKFYSEKDRLISEIYNVANQVSNLGGLYTGYEISEL